MINIQGARGSPKMINRGCQRVPVAKFQIAPPRDLKFWKKKNNSGYARFARRFARNQYRYARNKCISAVV